MRDRARGEHHSPAYTLEKPGSFAAIYTITSRIPAHSIRYLWAVYAPTHCRTLACASTNTCIYIYTQCAPCVRFRVHLAQQEAERYRGRATYVCTIFDGVEIHGGKEIGEYAGRKRERERERTFPRFEKYIWLGRGRIEEANSQRNNEWNVGLGIQ